MKQIIKNVIPGGIGEEIGLEPGDAILSIDGQIIDDILDYYFCLDGECIELEILTKDGETVTCEVEKEEDEDLGLEFEEEFMGKYRHCANRCIFCFIDQMPKGMRPTLYFKDDDARLSFLSGNYITMTNMSEEDFQKIIRYRMSPINVSVHATDPQLRIRMLKNPRAGELLPRLKQLKDAGIVMNAQIVLVKGVNDGEALDRTIRELSAFRPEMQSVGIVPVGLSDHREGLEKLAAFDKESAALVIDQVEPYQRRFAREGGNHFVHLSDEFYVLAERPLPEEERYDGYLQIENGVGMMRSFVEEAKTAIAELDRSLPAKGCVSLVTAPCAADYIKEICREIQEIYPELQIKVHVIINHFFGEHITVTGLLTGGDIMDQLKGKELGKVLLLPENLLKADEEILLDDTTPDDIAKTLHTPVFMVKSSGADFVRTVLDGGMQ